MSKTTRPPDKARPETVSKRAASVKEKNMEKKSPAVSKKQLADLVSTTTSHQEISGSGKKKAVRREQTAALVSAAPATVQVPKTAADVSGEDTPSQLLRRTKTTTSALALLERGIESIHRKDFKKALVDLHSLIEKYPNDTEITASARGYLEICRRSEERRKNTLPQTHNQIYALGVMEHNKTNYDKAIEYFRQSLEKYPGADYIYYSIAASLTLKGDVSAAIENLRKAVELNKDSRVHAKNDPDFAALENNNEFLELIGVSASCRI